MLFRSLSLLGGLLVSFHSGISDQILLLPVFVLIMGSCIEKRLRLALALSLTPIPYFTGLGVNVVMPLVLLVVLTLAVGVVAHSENRILPTVT